VEEINALMQGFGSPCPRSTCSDVRRRYPGIIIGVLPGLGGANGVAILLPLTFSMAQQPGGTTSAIILLRASIGARSSRSHHVDPLHIPASPGPVATTFDGHPLAQLGRAGKRADRGVYLLVHRGADRRDHDSRFSRPSWRVLPSSSARRKFFAVYLLTFWLLSA